ncbi:MAG: hypothetical protein LUE17_01480 [Planctomycetaceae bacterium]|nr:hypothetical protein [Planctomycetaceae bacterium]
MSMELRLEARRREQERELLRKREAEFAADLRAVAAHAEGKRLLRWLLAQGELFSLDYLPGTAGAYQAGRKATALKLWHLLRGLLAPNAFAEIALASDRGDSDPEAAQDGRGEDLFQSNYHGEHDARQR